MKKSTFIITLLILPGLILSACTAGGKSASLAGTSWKLVSYGPAGSQTPAAPGIETNVSFGQDGTVGGSVGCNSFSGSYEVKGGKLVFGALMSTMMACPEPQMTQESTAFQVMTGTCRFEISGDTLTIYDPTEAMAITLSK